MLRLFQISFATGVLFTVVSFVLGQLFDFLDFDGDIDMEGDLFGMAVSPLKPIIITAFITVFGGTGMMVLKEGVNRIMAFMIAFAVAFIIAFLLYKFVIAPLYRAQNTSAISQKEMIGKRAKVKLKIVGSSFGSISYIVNGNTYTAPARSIDGIDIDKDEEVEIINIENNIFFVSRI